MGKQSFENVNKVANRENNSFHILLLLGAFVLVVVWAIESFAGLTQLFDDISYGITLFVIVLCFWLSHYHNNPTLAKVIIFFQIAGYLLAVTVIDLIQVAQQGNLYPISSTLQWLPIIYIVAFLFLSKFLALVSSLIVYGLLAVLLVFSYTSVFPQHDTELKVLMFNMLLAHGLYIVAMFSVMRLRRVTLLQQIREQELEKEANLDSLLGIANRRYLQKLMDRFVAEQHPVSMLLIDVDYFKKINDTCGHIVGDQVLIQLVACIQDSLRPVDVLGRWGGEEFLVLADCAVEEHATSLAKRIKEQVQNYTFSGSIQVTVSVGVADYSGHGEMEQTFNQADKALYEAKARGRNMTIFYPDLGFKS